MRATDSQLALQSIEKLALSKIDQLSNNIDQWLTDIDQHSRRLAIVRQMKQQKLNEWINSGR
jgi:hypothetical protein